MLSRTADYRAVLKESLVGDVFFNAICFKTGLPKVPWYYKFSSVCDKHRGILISICGLKKLSDTHMLHFRMHGFLIALADTQYPNDWVVFMPVAGNRMQMWRKRGQT